MGEKLKKRYLAELDLLDGILSAAIADGDIVGVKNFETRIAVVRRELEELNAHPVT